jgi:hypothetical protein
MRGEVTESAHQQDDKNNHAQFHGFFDLNNLPDTDTACRLPLFRGPLGKAHHRCPLF